MKKISIFLATIIIIMITLSGNIFAKTSYDAVVTANKLEVREQEEIIISMSLGNYQEISTGMNAYKARIEYDEQIFEEISQTDFVSQNNWSNLKYNQGNHEFVAIKKAGSRQTEEVVQIRMKVKAGAKAGETVVGIREIVSSEGKEDVITADRTVGIKVIQQQDNPIINEGNNIKPGIGKDDTIAGGKIPKTGENYFKIGIIILIEILIIVAIIYGINIKK